MMTSEQIRSSFLTFFEDRGHAIVPSAPVIPFEDPTLLFTNAGMNQFKDVFLGTGKRPYSRAADTQKCIRVSGKHNDLEEVGRDTYHHTFFEMLGNWSFGDYYKKEAIEWAWELLTQVWKLPKKRLWATVYRDDDEAAELWTTVTDIDPSHVLRFGEKENFWEMGETGPCGPCSEIHFDQTPGGNATASMVNAGTPDVMEIWNLVFIQYDRHADGSLHPLPAKHVDTGMGFERICAILQKKSSNYDTDVFMPLIGELGRISGTTYDGRTGGEISRHQLDVDIALRVAVDHVRALTFAIADGAIPSNEGRGYVLRRILRRASRFGRNLGLHEPFLFRLVPTLVQTMGHVFPEVKSKQDHIQNVIRAEEEAFGSTLDRGLEIFGDVVRATQSGGARTISGEDAFKLYDTFGFPVDLTDLMAREQGLSVDLDRFNVLLEEQRTRSRESGRTVSAPAIVKRLSGDRALKETDFVGYDMLSLRSSPVVAAEDEFVVLEKTPFYAEAGGQVGDTGVLRARTSVLEVIDTQRDGGIILHRVKGNPSGLTGHAVEASVDADRRRDIMRNHTATHLVHAALRKILGTHVHQAGSLVAPDHLRFDFTHFTKVEDAQLEDIEGLVNEKIQENIPLTHYRNIPFEQARTMGALMFFGDKYGDRVNVVEFGDFSREFCGGTHAKSTGEIGYFKFRSESSVASGTRRIEATTGDHARELLKLREVELGDRISRARTQAEELLELCSGTDLSRHLSALIHEALRDLELMGKAEAGFPSSPGVQFRDQDRRRKAVEDIVLKLADARRQVEKRLLRSRVDSQAATIDGLVKGSVSLNGLRLVSAEVSVASMEELKALGDKLRERIGSGVGVLGSILEQKVALVCVVTDDVIASKKLEAGKIVGAIARLVGGGGGGRPHLATAGGKDIAGLPAALKNAETIVRSFLKNKE